MADERAKPDVNSKAGGVVGGYASTDAIGAASPTIVMLRINPTTGRLLVDSTSGTGVIDGEAVDAADFGNLVLGTDGSNYQVLSVNSSGRLQVDVVSGGGGGTQYTEGDTDATITGTAMLMEGAGNALVVAQGTAADGLLVNLGSNNDVVVTNAGTFVVQVDGSALTALQNMDTDLTTIIGHVDGIEGLLTTIDGDTGALAALILGTQADDIANTADGLQTSSFLYVFDGTTWDRLRGDATNGMLVNLGSNNDVTLATLPDTAGGDLAAINTAVTELAGAVNGAQFDVDLKASDVDLMLGTDFSNVLGTASLILATQADDVVNTSDGLQTSSFLYVFDGTTWDRLRGNSTDGVLVNLGANNDVVVTNAGTFVVQENGSALTALQLIDDVIYVDDADWTADTSKHALVGSVTQVVPAANTDGDTTPLISDALRQLRIAALESDLATAGTSHVKKYYTSAGAATDGIIWSPAAGKRWYCTLLTINVSSACTVTIEDDLAGGDSPVYKAEFAANSGVVLPFGADAPMFSGEDAADLLVTTTAGNVYITAIGYEI